MEEFTKVNTMDDHETTRQLLTQFRDAAREIAQEVREIRIFYEEQRRLQKRLFRALLITLVFTLLIPSLALVLLAIFGRHQ